MDLSVLLDIPEVAQYLEVSPTERTDRMHARAVRAIRIYSGSLRRAMLLLQTLEEEYDAAAGTKEEKAQS